jgi:hypothetical protein
VVQTFKREDLDTASLEKNLATYATLVADFTAAQQAFIAAAEISALQACGTEGATFKTGLADARAQLKSLQDAREAVRKQLGVIKTDIQALRALLPSPSPSAAVSAVPATPAAAL